MRAREEKEITNRSHSDPQRRSTSEDRAPLTRSLARAMGLMFRNGVPAAMRRKRVRHTVHARTPKCCTKRKRAHMSYESRRNCVLKIKPQKHVSSMPEDVFCDRCRQRIPRRRFISRECLGHLPFASIFVPVNPACSAIPCKVCGLWPEMVLTW